jgi:hypothetical protein
MLARIKITIPVSTTHRTSPLQVEQMPMRQITGSMALSYLFSACRLFGCFVPIGSLLVDIRPSDGGSGSVVTSYAL